MILMILLTSISNFPTHLSPVSPTFLSTLTVKLSGSLRPPESDLVPDPLGNPLSGNGPIQGLINRPALIKVRYR